MRQTWRLLLVVGIGVLVAVILVCAVPPYSQITMSVGLRDTLKTSSIGPYVKVQGIGEDVSQTSIQSITQQLDQEMRQHLNGYLAGPVQFSVQHSLALSKPTPGPEGKTTFQVERDQVALIGTDIPLAAEHVKLLQGRLPQVFSNPVEIAITPQTAALLHGAPGSMLFVQFSFTQSFQEAPFQKTVTINLPLRIVGLFTPATDNDSFWHGESFQPGPLAQPSSAVEEPPTRYPVLTSNTAYLSVLEQEIQHAAPPNQFVNSVLTTNLQFFWYYPLNTSRFDVSDLNTLIIQLNQVLGNLSDNPIYPPYVEKTAASGPLDTLALYSSRVAVVNIPLTSMACLIVLLVLLFVSLMTDVLVNRQSEAMALLRSRGASRRQVFVALVTQSIGVGLLTLVLGPVLAVFAALLLAHTLLSPADQGAINVLTTKNLLSIAWSLRWLALLTVGMGVFAMIISIALAMRADVLAIRREVARSTYRPLWQRLRLDLLAAVVALVGYGFSVYITAPGILDERVRVLILPPVTVVGALFLLLGCNLLLLRFLPQLLRFAAQLAVRGRSATPVLALAQMARAPRQAMRAVLLLALALAFAIFTLAFMASQQQRVLDVAAFQVGADFSGTLPLNALAGADTWKQQEQEYRNIPGVTSATIGYSNLLPVSDGSLNTSVDLLAVDATTYGQTSIWTAQDASQPVQSLMSQLIAERAMAGQGKAVAAIVDAAAANLLHLSIGSHFTINNVNDPVNAVVVAEVGYIPTISDSAEVSGTSDTSSFGGVLVDYQSYAAYLSIVNNAGVTPTTVWLRTRNDAASLAAVRAALSRGNLQLSGVNDRLATIEALRHDPLYLALSGLIIIGVVTTMLLAVVGNLVLSYLYTRSHVVNFAVMKALGSTSQQVARVLLWEQGMVYAAAIILGISFGALFSLIALPGLVFTGVALQNGNANQISGGQFYILQNVPPVQVVIPAWLLIIVLGILLSLCLVGMSMMVRITAGLSVSRVLRLSQD
ncbi:MAG TPA: FtsX-like permease family protein [Ktedonobacteraceae bacterium]|nr:FtsX-like permease family protein [Ktedonobacteraceae bacterium]